jgi:hypothetical protein
MPHIYHINSLSDADLLYDLTHYITIIYLTLYVPNGILDAVTNAEYNVL